ncbi:hypothetical protein [Pontibacter aquaedesilientis]|uniref:hypothetical protein n=1 Tax=Pontibacter aquaedesilientis TaxID=2766980 RepID=UPI001CD136CF|nr:hypothetical protein [Pontibacter aquaedesilientis]
MLLLPFLYACNNNCEGIDCLSVESVAFTITSSETREDLLFGDNASLGAEDIEVYYMQNGTKQPAFVRFEADYALVAVDPEITAYYVTALDQTDSIKLAISRTSSSECCLSTSALEQISVNNQILPADIRVINLRR